MFCPTRPVRGTLKRHPCQKPVSVMRWLINALSDPGDLVASPFCGVAPCGIAPIHLGRNYHGIDTNDNYRKIAQDRLRAFGKPEATPQPKKKEGPCLKFIPAKPNSSTKQPKRFNQIDPKAHNPKVARCAGGHNR